MELDHTDDGPAAAPPGAAGPDTSWPSFDVQLYVGLVLAAGLASLGVVCGYQAALLDWLAPAAAGWYALAVLLFIGELRPLQVPRGEDDTDRVTVSSTFATALVLIGPLSLAMLAQAAAVSIDDLRHHKRPRVILFNVGQYMLTLLGTRLVFAAASGHSLLAPTTSLRPSDLGPALLAGAAYFILNNGLVALAVAMDSGANPLSVLREDVRIQGLTSLILLGLAPVAAQAAIFSPLMLPLLVLPILGVHHNAKLALRRQHEALHDHLTDLPNRQLLRQRAEQALAASRAGRHRMAVMLLDLDHFKEINDTLGHHVGDQVIREVGSRLLTFVPPGATVARLGGDEFAIICPQIHDLIEVEAIAATICARLEEPVVIDGVRLAVQGSIGIAVAPDHADSVEILLKRADIALYRAKNRRGDVQIYGPEIDSHTLERLSLLGDLHSALEDDEFVLVFQPQIDCQTGRVTGVEALMRWLHPRHGLVSPDVFIPLAENTNLMGPLSRMAVSRSAAELRRWVDQGHDLTVAVNLSARLLSDMDLPQWILESLLHHGLPASRLTIEVTESTIMADPKRAMQILRRLRDMGVKLAVDDFGTGYSSLAYLRRLAVDELKIDKSFVMQMGSDENSAIIVRSTVELAHSLGLTVVAEGVEDEPTLQALTDLGCDRVQGFHLGRPMSPEALTVWLAERAAAAADTVTVGRST